SRTRNSSARPFRYWLATVFWEITRALEIVVAFNPNWPLGSNPIGRFSRDMCTPIFRWHNSVAKNLPPRFLYCRALPHPLLGQSYRRCPRAAAPCDLPPRFPFLTKLHHVRPINHDLWPPDRIAGPGSLLASPVQSCPHALGDP